MKRVFERRFAQMARDVAATAEAIALTYETLSDDLLRSEPARTRLRRVAEGEHTEARRLWQLAEDLDPIDAASLPDASAGRAHLGDRDLSTRRVSPPRPS